MLFFVHDASLRLGQHNGVWSQHVTTPSLRAGQLAVADRPASHKADGLDGALHTSISEHLNFRVTGLRCP